MSYQQLQTLNQFVLSKISEEIEVEPARFYFLFALFDTQLTAFAVRLLQRVPENQKFLAPKMSFKPIDLAQIRNNGVINSKISGVNFGSVLESYKIEVLKTPSVSLTNEEVRTHIIPALYHLQRTHGKMHPGLIVYLNYELFMTKL